MPTYSIAYVRSTGSLIICCPDHEFERVVHLMKPTLEQLDIVYERRLILSNTTALGARHDENAVYDIVYTSHGTRRLQDTFGTDFTVAVRRREQPE
jgi:hypothetical protein